MSGPISSASPTRAGSAPAGQDERFAYLDATRAFALLLGVVFHASLSFSPIFMGWAVMDVSTHAFVSGFVTVSHSFRMEIFFLIAGFLSARALAKKGLRVFATQRAVRLGVPFVVGWFLLRPLLVSGWIMGFASLRGPVDVRAALVGGFADFKCLPNGLFTGSHLWFLYYLALVTALWLVARFIVNAAPLVCASLTSAAQRALGWVSQSRAGIPALIVLTVCALWRMDHWSVNTPDRSLVPDLPVLLLYGFFFVMGGLLGRWPEQMSVFTRVTWTRIVTLSVAVVVTVALAPVEHDKGRPLQFASHLGFAVAYATMMWLFVALILGVFRIWMHRSRDWILYLSEASYWIYLIHLPVVVWAQVAVAEWPLPWWAKWILVSGFAAAVALLIYDLGVRGTFVGQILNGRRRPSNLVARFAGAWRSHRLLRSRAQTQ